MLITKIFTYLLVNTNNIHYVLVNLNIDKQWKHSGEIPAPSSQGHGFKPSFCRWHRIDKMPKICWLQKHSPNCRSLQTIFKIYKLVQILAISESRVVEHLPHHPKVTGSSPAVAASTGLIKCQNYIDFKNHSPNCWSLWTIFQYSKYNSWYKYWQTVKAEW